MTEQQTSLLNPLQVPARHLTAGDHFFSWMVSSLRNEMDWYGRTLVFREFTVITPYQSNGFTITVQEDKLDQVIFPVHKRGDSHSPTARNKALGLPEDLDKPVYKKAEPVARYEVGTKIKDLKHFDRSQHVLFKCPEHENSAWSSKDPYCSSIFPQSDSTRDCAPGCKVKIGDYVLTHVYLPTRNG